MFALGAHKKSGVCSATTRKKEKGWELHAGGTQIKGVVEARYKRRENWGFALGHTEKWGKFEAREQEKTRKGNHSRCGHSMKRLELKHETKRGRKGEGLCWGHTKICVGLKRDNKKKGDRV